MSFKDSNIEANVNSSIVQPYLSSKLSDVITAQPSFKKLFYSESQHYKHSLNSLSSSKSHASFCPYRWYRNRSSSYMHQTPPLLQINAGKRILQKYRRFARNLEYKRLHSIIPSLSKRKYASKVGISSISVKFK